MVNFKIHVGVCSLEFVLRCVNMHAENVLSIIMLKKRVQKHVWFVEDNIAALLLGVLLTQLCRRELH